MAKKCARTFSIVVEKGKKSILEVSHLLPDALPRSVRHAHTRARACATLILWPSCLPPRRGRLLPHPCRGIGRGLGGQRLLV